MKRCPTCNRTYEDDSLSFCLDDGTPLLSASSYDPEATIKIPAGRVTNQAATEVLKDGTIPPTRPALPATEKYVAPMQTAPQERKQSALPWILGAALILGVSAIVVALIVTRNNGSNNSQVAQKTDNTSQSTNASSTIDPSASVTTSNVANPSITSNSTVSIDTTGKTQTSRTPESSAAAKPTPPTTTAPTAPISGGVLNGKAISLPKPAYPPIARAAHASGTVIVQVMIDESGKVISAHAVSGHPLLQQSAVQAAYEARFSPTLMSGQPVKVTGVINYNFVAQ
ncbi:MAG: hypothetical protein DMF68_09445 [Acidobacteria bacterium]|nr:MAG: hypothetical protein DMF68_09445 [Acidobacteriota bacterium]